jgi:hypothetical protein
MDVITSVSWSSDRGRERLTPPPPSEPDWQISRIRLSSWWFYPRGDRQARAWARCKLKSPCLAKKALGQ